MQRVQPGPGIPGRAVLSRGGWTRRADVRMLGPMSLRVALLTPFAFPSVRGNAVTVARVAQGLRARGVELEVWDLSLRPEAAVEAEVDAFRPAVIHAFHAYRVGPLALRVARRAEIPLVVTLTGTDANHDLFDPERASVVRRVLEGASRLTAFHASIVERIAGALPDLRGRLVAVPQSAPLDTTEPFRSEERRVGKECRSRWSAEPSRKQGG